MARGDERFRLAFEAAPTAMILVDEQGRIVLANAHAERLFGYSRDELLQQSIEMLVPTAFRNAHGEHRSGFAADPRARPMGADRELRALRKDGVEVPVEIGLNPIRTDDGAFVMAAVLDISERRRAQKALAQKNEENARLASIVESSGDAIIGATLEGTIVSWNRGATRIFGLREDEARGASVLDVVAGEGADERTRLAERLGRAADFSTFELVGPSRDGRRLELSITLSTVKEQDGRPGGFSIVARDVTDFGQMQEELARNRSLAAVGEMAATVAHEVRNPLAAISGPLQVLARGMDAGDPRRDLIGEILGQVKRLDDTVRGLLAISRDPAPRKQLVVLRDVIESVARLLAEHEAARGVRVQIDDNESTSLVADPSLLEQVFWNLFLNAAEAMHGKGEIRIAMHGRADAVEVAISDSGGGIAPEVLSRLFRPFVTTKPSGTGLGLPLCRKLVEAHGGTIAIDNHAGRGTTLRLKFPR